MLQQVLGIAIGTPIAMGLLYGLGAKAKKVKARQYAITGLAAMAAAVAVMTIIPPAPAVAVRAPAAVAAAVPCGKSVSDVTVQLGRYSEGVKYPGQITGAAGPSAQYTDSGLIFVNGGLGTGPGTSQQYSDGSLIYVD